MKTYSRIAFDACPMCGHETATAVREGDATRDPIYRPALPPVISWVRCDGCGHCFTDGYFDAEATAFIRSATDPDVLPAVDVPEFDELASRVVDDIGGLRAPQPGRWLQVGVGSGELLAAAAAFDHEVVGIDVRRDVAEAVGTQGYDIEVCELVAFTADEPFDIIAISDALEAMVSPVAAIEHALELLAPNGVLYVAAADFESDAWKILDVADRNPYWHRLERYHHFSHQSLDNLLRERGAEPQLFAQSRSVLAGVDIIAVKPPE